MSKLIPGVFGSGGNLTDSSLNHFKTYGFLQFKNFLDRETVAAFLQEIKQVESYLLANEITKINGIPLKMGRDLDGAPLIQRIAFASNYWHLTATSPGSIPLLQRAERKK